LPAEKIMLIRHAEKPDANGNLGVTVTGREDPRELSVRGWQRAGALLGLFAPSGEAASVLAIATPIAIFASSPSPNSVRPLRTVETLAERLAIEVDASYGNGDEATLIVSAMGAGRVVLISWKHDGLPKLANAIVGNAQKTPQRWPAERFDVVWVFDRAGDSGGWTFEQVPQLLLPGDRAEPILR
jgi:broad specificity phosphatase PhoE